MGFTLAIAAADLVLVSIGQVAPSPGQIAEGIPNLLRLAERMSPPNTDPAFLGRIFWKIVETFQIALAGAAIGIALSLPIGWVAARGAGPFGALGAFLAKALVSFLRAVPDLVWALVFVATVGLGAVAGTMSIVVDTIGFRGRFFTEAIEDSDKEPQEAIAAIGGNRMSILLGAMLPDVMPSFINRALFSLEKAVRSSVVLGLVGAGGIGQELKVAFDLFQYRNAATIILVIFLIVLGMEWLTDRLRRRVQ